MTPEDSPEIHPTHAAAALGRLGGRVRSAAKVKAARKNVAKARATKSAAKAKASAENGRKGGRPRKAAVLIRARIVEHADRYTLVNADTGESLEDDGGLVGYSYAESAAEACDERGWVVVNRDEFTPHR